MNINEFEIKSQISDERISNSFFAWLNTIAHNLYMDFLKERSKTLYSDCSYEELECEEPRPDDFEFEIDQNTDILLQEAWDSLDEREKYIVNICIKYNCLDNKNHLPDNEIKEICKELFIEKGHIRVIKFRALKKLQKIRKVHEKSK
jgi:RNA polymerase sigma factor (sigma-70 family)